MTVWIDVRTPEEFVSGHIAGALNISHDVITQHIDALNLEKSADIRVYCRTGRRSGMAKEFLEQLGYQQVTNEGGYEELLARKASGESIP